MMPTVSLGWRKFKLLLNIRERSVFARDILNYTRNHNLMPAKILTQFENDEYLLHAPATH
jgi:hypothetical protein